VKNLIIVVIILLIIVFLAGFDKAHREISSIRRNSNQLAIAPFGSV